MSPTDPERLLGRKPDCPSEMELDLFHWGELDADRAASVDEHVKKCPQCKKRLELREMGFGAFPEVDELAIRRKIVHSAARQSDHSGRDARQAGWFFWRAALGTAVLFVLLVSVALWVTWSEPRGDDGLRTKGSPGFTVYRERDGRVTEALPGETFHRGDRLRFVVDMPAAGELMIVGVEQSGKLYPVFPAKENPSSRLVRAGTARELPGAIRLDESVGSERLHMVVCPEKFDIGKLETGARGILEAPEGCKISTFAFRKEEP